MPNNTRIPSIEPKTSLDSKFIDELKKENIETESFRRYLAKREIQLQDNETLDLTEVKTSYVRLQKELAARVAEAFNKTEKSLPKSVLMANELAAEARALAPSRRARADILQSELSQINLGMTPSDYAQRTSGEFIEQLEKLAAGRARAVAEVKKLADAFEKHARALTTNQIDAATYIANCKKNFEASASLLSQAHTFIERASAFVLTTIRGLFNGFDRLYSWLISAETTIADTKGRKFIIPALETALAQKVNQIHKELEGLEKEIASSESKNATQAEKSAKREALKLKVNNGEAPREIQERIDAAKEKEEKREEEREGVRAHNQQARKEAHEKRMKRDVTQRVINDERLTAHVITLFKKLKSDEMNEQRQDESAASLVNGF